MKIARNCQKEQAPEIRIKNFDEVTERFDNQTAQAEAQRCLQCKNAPCKKGCPVGVNIPEFIKEIVCGDFNAAIQIINATSNLPAVCGRVCPQEEQCEKLCVRARVDQPVAIGALERFIADTALENDSVSLEIKKTAHGKVAVVGSGPAGLACAADCARNGLKVTVFEAFHKAGGVLVYGIPEFRLPKALVEKEISTLKKLGVQIELNTVIGKTITIEQLKAKYDAVFIGSGAGLPQFLNIKGENLNGVFSANEYLTRINLMGAYRDDCDTPVMRGKNVAVFGAGNVAMDAARTALRMGADKVSIIYRRDREQIPARAEEIIHAEDEGVQILPLLAPLEILGEKSVSGVRCIRCRLGEPDASGRRSSEQIIGSEFIIDCDMVIVAVGSSPNPLLKKSCPDLKTTNRGTLIIDESGMTSIDGFYAGGDAVTGAATVISAMEAGRKAAHAIIERIKKKV